MRNICNLIKLAPLTDIWFVKCKEKKCFKIKHTYVQNLTVVYLQEKYIILEIFKNIFWNNVKIRNKGKLIVRNAKDNCIFN